MERLSAAIGTSTSEEGMLLCFLSSPTLIRHSFIATGRNTNLQSLSASGHALPPSSLELLGAAIAKKRSGLVRLAIGDKNMGDDGAVALCAGLGNGGGGLQELDLEWKDL